MVFGIKYIFDRCFNAYLTFSKTYPLPNITIHPNLHPGTKHLLVKPEHLITGTSSEYSDKNLK